MVCGTEIENGKPAPDIFLKCAKLLGEKPENCRVFTFTLPLQLDVPARPVRQEKGIKGIETGKEEIKLSLVANNKICSQNRWKNWRT